MAFRLVSSGGNVTDPAILNMRASGTVHPGGVVDFSRTGGAGVTPASFASTVTMIFGVSLDYAQGACDETMVKVIPFAPGQIWEADCVNTAATTNIGLRMGLCPSAGAAGTDRELYLENPISTDTTTATAIFRCTGIVSAIGTGSAKILGYFRRGDDAGVGTIGAPYETTAY